MTDDVPVQIEVFSPPRFERSQLLLRLLLGLALGWLGVAAGALLLLLYPLLPLLAAVAISSEGSAAYTTGFGVQLWRALVWCSQASAFLGLLVDRFPNGEDVTRPQLVLSGEPSVGSALARLVTSIPSFLGLLLLWPISCVFWLVSAAAVALGRLPPEAVMAFQRGILRWQLWLAAYHASLVDQYPPFSLDTSASVVPGGEAPRG